MASGDTLYIWTPHNNEPPASNPATPDLRNNDLCLDFDGATDEEAVFKGIMPSHYGGGGVTLKLHVRCTSATTGSMRFQTSFEQDADHDIDADGFASANSGGGSASGTSGKETIVSISHSDGSEMDSVAAGGLFRLKVRRDADGTSGTDDITTDVELVAIEMIEQ